MSSGWTIRVAMEPADSPATVSTRAGERPASLVAVIETPGGCRYIGRACYVPATSCDRKDKTRKVKEGLGRVQAMTMSRNIPCFPNTTRRPHFFFVGSAINTQASTLPGYEHSQAGPRAIKVTISSEHKWTL